MKPLVCDHSNESYWDVISCAPVDFVVQGGFNFQVLVGVKKGLCLQDIRVCLIILPNIWSQNAVYSTKLGVYFEAQIG